MEVDKTKDNRIKEDIEVKTEYLFGKLTAAFTEYKKDWKQSEDIRNLFSKCLRIAETYGGPFIFPDDLDLINNKG